MRWNHPHTLKVQRGKACLKLPVNVGDSYDGYFLTTMQTYAGIVTPYAHGWVLGQKDEYIVRWDWLKKFLFLDNWFNSIRRSFQNQYSSLSGRFKKKQVVIGLSLNASNLLSHRHCFSLRVMNAIANCKCIVKVRRSGKITANEGIIRIFSWCRRVLFFVISWA